MSAFRVYVLLFLLADVSASENLVATPMPTNSFELSAKFSSDIGRFEIRNGLQNSEWLDAKYRETLWQQANNLRVLNKQSPQSQEEYLLSPEYSTAKMMLELRGTMQTGHATHTWIFDEPDSKGGMIVRALELQDLSSTSGYHVSAIVHCYDEPENCKAFRDRQTALLAPKPVSEAGNLAIRQWRNRVNAEACTVFAKNMRQPQYPPTALRDGIEGSVLVGIVFNTCGNVRDAWIHQSSGNRELDRAAQIQALKWQIEIQSLPKTLLEPGHAVVPVRFLLGDEPAIKSSNPPIK